jgi:serine/threonine-protein kinase
MDHEAEQLGKYEILEELGKGGFATVYRALDPTLDREVALKVLDPLLMRDEAWVERFEREARVIARLSAPHIVTIFEIGEADDRLFIAMELVDEPSLDQVINERGRLPWEETLDVLGQVAEALDYAHDEGILHRDLKPANVLLDPRRGAILTDFGFAKLVSQSSLSVSISGGVVGTPAYIAPEVWDGEGATRQTDVYALACIAYEMLTGQVLFAGRTPSEMMRKHLIDGPKFEMGEDVGLQAPSEDVLRRALTRNPQRRYRTAQAFVTALRRGTGLGAKGKPAARAAVDSVHRPRPSGNATGKDREQQHRKRARLGGILAALVLTAILSAAGGWLVWGPGLPWAVEEATPVRTQPRTVAPTDPATAPPTLSPTQRPTEPAPEAPAAEPTERPTVAPAETPTAEQATTLPQPTQATTAAPSEAESRAAARETVESFQSARYAAYATWDTGQYYEILADDALASSLKVIDQLRESDCRYYFPEEEEMQFTFEEVTSTRVVVIAHRYETQQRVCPGSTEYVCQDYDGRYVVEKLEERWYVTHKSVEDYTQVTPCP